MGLVLSNGSLTTNTTDEKNIRTGIINADLVDCVVGLPKNLFYNVSIPACLWFLSRKKTGNGDRKRTGEILFIDATEVGHMVDKVHRIFTDEDVLKLANTYHEWRKQNGNYEDIKGYCKSATLKEVEKHKFVLAPGRYVGIPDEVDDGIPFDEKLTSLTDELIRQMSDGKRLDAEIKKQLSTIGIDI